MLENVGHIKASSTIVHLLQSVQHLIWERKQPFSIIHIRAYTGLPGPIAEGNAMADFHTRTIFAFLASTPVQLAADFHNKFQVNANTLRLKFKITREQA